MRTDGCHTTCDLFASQVTETLTKPILNFIQLEARPIDHSRHLQAQLSTWPRQRVKSWFVDEAQDLRSMRQFMMDACCQSVDLLDSFDTPQNDLRAKASQRVIPHFKLVTAPTAFTQRFQQCVALRESLAIFTQYTCIRRSGLCQRKIEITAAVIRCAFNDLRHLRQ